MALCSAAFFSQSIGRGASGRKNREQRMKTIGTLAVLLICGSAAVAGDWPQWLGPNRDGSTAEKVAPWKEPLKVLWNKPVGEGHSSPVVVKGQVFLHTQVQGKDEEQITAYDAKSGGLIWQSAPTARAKFADPVKFRTGPRATPAEVAGKTHT